MRRLKDFCYSYVIQMIDLLVNIHVSTMLQGGYFMKIISVLFII